MTAARHCLRALIAALLAAAAILAWAPSARADDGGLIDVSITSISTPVLDLAAPDQVVELAGTLVNTSSTRVRFVAVNFWQSSEAITTHEALAATLALPADRPVGKRTMPNDEESGNVQVITREDWLDPGARVEFRVRATIAQLALPTPEAVYLLGAQVRGIPEGATGRSTVGRGRILALASADRVPISVVASLTARPTQLAGGDFVDESLLDELTGRLDQLLGAAERNGGTVLVDPSVVAEAEALSKEHTVGGQTTAARPEAAAWVNRLRALAADGRALRLPYGDPALARADTQGALRDVLDRSAAATVPDVLRGAPSAVDLTDLATEPLVASLSAAGLSTVFADNIAGHGASLIGVSSATLPGMGPGDTTNAAQTRGRRLAEEFLAPSPRVYLLRDEADIRAVGPLDAHHRIVPVLSGDSPTEILPSATPPAPWTQLTARIDGLAGEADFLYELTGLDSRATIDLMAAKAWSSSFQTQDAALAYVQAHPVAGLDPDKVAITAAKQFVMGSRTNEFPVTITNGLPVPVTVALTFDSEAPQRLRVPDTAPITIRPGESQTLNVAPEARANGIVTVHARLETTSGTPFGQSVTIEITATDLGRVAWIVIIVSGAVVLGGTFARIRAVQSGRARKESS